MGGTDSTDEPQPLGCLPVSGKPSEQLEDVV